MIAVVLAAALHLSAPSGFTSPEASVAEARGIVERSPQPVFPVVAGMLMLLSACTASRDAYNPALRYSPEELREDYDLLRRLMERYHPSLYWYTPKDSMDMAFDAGVTLFDTADIYDRGRSEEILGRALAGIPRDRYTLATKCGNPMSDTDPTMRGLSPTWIRRACDDSLRRLGVDHIDVYQAHRPDPTVPLEDSLGVFHELVTAGKVRAIGTSCFGPSRLAEAARLCERHRWMTVTSEQPPYSLLARGIEPHLTLYHWDLPQALQDRGGWLARDSAAWFADYAGVVAARYGDRVRHFATFNEPSVFTLFGYGFAWHPPGHKDRPELLRAIHHVNLAHGAGVDAIRAAAPAALTPAPCARFT